MRICSGNNPAKFHPDPFWNIAENKLVVLVVVAFLEEVAPNKKKKKKKKKSTVAIWDQFLQSDKWDARSL